MESLINMVITFIIHVYPKIEEYQYRNRLKQYFTNMGNKKQMKVAKIKFKWNYWELF